MKRLAPYFLCCFGFLLLGFMPITVFKKKEYIDTSKLLGKWQISEVTVDGTKINLDLVPHCENKENIEFKDSANLKWENYLYRKNRCFKSINDCNYAVEYHFDRSKNTSIPRLEIYIGKQRKFDLEYTVLTLNDTFLKLKKNHEDILKCYKKIR